MIERKVCDICKFNEFKVFEAYPRWPHIEIVKCTACGYIFTKQIPDDKEYEELYNNFHQIETFSVSNLKILDNAKFNQKINSYKQIIDSIKKNSRSTDYSNIFEIGCYLGGFLGYARNLGYTTYSCEVNPHYVDYVNSKGHICYLGDISQLDLKKHFFDIIVLQEVFEHVTKPVDLLISVFEMLRPEGLIIIEIPNMPFHYWKGKFEKSILARIFPNRAETGLAPSYHLNHFTIQSIKNLLQRIGGEIIQVQIRKSKAVAERHSKFAIIALLFWNYVASFIYKISFVPAGNALIVTAQKKG